MNGKMLAYTVV